MSQSAQARAPAAVETVPAGDRFVSRRLLRAGLVGLAGSVVATALIRAITVSVVDVPKAFKPLMVGSVISLTILGVIAATACCFALNRLVRRPVATFRRIAPIALVLSFVPDVAIWASHAYDHTARASTVIPLMLMHVAVGAICLTALAGFGAAPRHAPS